MAGSCLNEYGRVAERVWLLMAAIRTAVSERPVIRRDPENRRLADCACKALFDLHRRLDQASEGHEGGTDLKGQGETMLRITIELLPGGRADAARVIGRGRISNVSALADLSNYVFTFEEAAWMGQARGPYSGTLSQWPRTERGAWAIVQAALAIALAQPGARAESER